MSRPVVRGALVLVLLLAGASAGWDAWRGRAAAPAEARERAALSDRIDRLLLAVVDLEAVQTGYVVPSADPARPLERFPALLRDVSAGVAGLSAAARAPDGTRALQGVVDSLSVVAQADSRARDALLLGDVVAASNVIVTESVPALSSIRGGLQAFRKAETSARDAERAASDTRTWAIVAGAALAWTAGLLLLAWTPSGRRSARDAAAAVAAPVDPVAVARLCTELARVESASDLTRLLDRGVSLLEATGITVWTLAGDEMVPVAARGYDAGAMATLKPVRRDDEHATAIAWRQGQTHVLAARDDAAGAIAAPLWGPRGCSGVLAVDLPRGREDDPLVRAAVEIVAAQLSSVVTGSDQPAQARATGT